MPYMWDPDGNMRWVDPAHMYQFLSQGWSVNRPGQGGGEPTAPQDAQQGGWLVDPQGNAHWVPPGQYDDFLAMGWTLPTESGSGGIGPGPGGGTPEDTPDGDTPDGGTPGGGTSENPWESQQGTIPGTGENRFLYKVGDVYYLVYEVPVDRDRDGQYDEMVPIAYACTPQDLVDAGLVNSVDDVDGLLRDTLTDREWRRMGGIIVGDVSELANPDEDPLELFVSQMTESSILYPWLTNPEIMALTAAAWLEGRALNEAELVGTRWWQNHTDSERAWLMLASQSPNSAQEMLRDNRQWVLRMFENSGVRNAPPELVNMIADRFTRGRWTQAYLQEQIALLADPSMRGHRAVAIRNWLDAQGEGFQLDMTRAEEDTVRDLALQWLGPQFGRLGQDQVREWAGRLRNDPDALQALERMLAQQRMALFPEYDDPSLTYEDIAGPWRNLVMNMWGEEADESSNLFVNLVRLNNVTEASALLRRVGMREGNGQVADDALDAVSASFGGQGIRMAQ